MVCAAAFRPAELSGHEPDIAGEDGGEIGVDHGGVAAAYEFDERRGLVACRNLRETERTGKLGRLLFMLGIFPGVHEDDGDSRNTVAPRRLHFRPDAVE